VPSLQVKAQNWVTLISNGSGLSPDLTGMPERKLIDVVTEPGKTVAITVLDLDGSVPVGGDAKVAGGLPNLSDALDSVKDFAASLREKLAVAQPTKTTVELSVTFGVRAGKLTALFVDGKADGTMTLTMEWDRKDSQDK
jgi:hypothetical protein